MSDPGRGEARSKQSMLMGVLAVSPLGSFAPLVAAAVWVYLGINVVDPPTVGALVAGSGVLAGLSWLLLVLRHGRVRVGADGVLISVRLGSSRFVSHADYDRAVLSAGHVLLMREGKRVARISLPEDPLRLRGLIQDARARYVDRDHAPRSPALERRDRSFEQWRSELSASADKTDYREPPLTADALARVAEDPATPAAERLVAAAAAIDAAPDAMRQRVRVAAGETAQPELADALERVADDRLTPRAVRRVLG